MKSLFYLIVLTFIFVNCGSTKTGTTSTSSEQTTLFSLTDMLRSKAGVSVQGNGKGAKVRIRTGGNSLIGSSEPLFIIEGQPINGGLASAIDMVNVLDIKRINVLKSATDLASYGVRGANGVIEIVLK